MKDIKRDIEQVNFQLRCPIELTKDTKFDVDYHGMSDGLKIDFLLQGVHQRLEYVETFRGGIRKLDIELWITSSKKAAEKS